VDVNFKKSELSQRYLNYSREVILASYIYHSHLNKPDSFSVAMTRFTLNA